MGRVRAIARRSTLASIFWAITSMTLMKASNSLSVRPLVIRATAARAESSRRAASEGALPPYPLRYPRLSRPTDIACTASSVPASGGRVETRHHLSAPLSVASPSKSITANKRKSSRFRNSKTAVCYKTKLLLRLNPPVGTEEEDGVGWL